MILKYTARTILKEQFFHYIKQKRTPTMKKLGNYLNMTFSLKKMKRAIRNFIIEMFSDVTTEKTISEYEEINTEVFDWVSTRIGNLEKSDNFSDKDNATALREEYAEWFEKNQDGGEIETIYLTRPS
jgi:hypothetical protein